MGLITRVTWRAAALSCLLLAGCNDSSADLVSQDTAAEQAYTFSVPIYKFFATQRSYIGQGFIPNYFVSAHVLADATLRTVTKPNHDTLYSIAWIKLDNGPLEIDTPESGARYFSLALMDAYTNNFAVRGTRADGGHAKRFWLVGPGWTGAAPEGTVLLQSGTNSVWALARTYVDGTPGDYAAAAPIQAQLRIVTPAGTAPSAFTATDKLVPPADTDWSAYFAYVDQLMTQDPPVAADTAYMAKGPNKIGVGAGLAYDAGALDQIQINDGATRARNAALKLPAGITSTGWAYATAGVGDYGTDYALRAELAESGLGALPDVEAVYYIANSAAATPGVPLAGDKVYRLVFPAGQLPPTDAFWSLTLYAGQDPAHEYFYPNPGNVFAISYPASMPVFGEDGSLTITISNVQPEGVPASNWLPAPSGSYSLQLRDYLPAGSVLSNTYVLPAITAAP